MIPFGAVHEAYRTVHATAKVQDIDLAALDKGDVRTFRGGEYVVAGKVINVRLHGDQVDFILKLSDGDALTKCVEGVFVGLIATAEGLFLVDSPKVEKSPRYGELRKLSKSDDLIKSLIAAENKKLEDLSSLQKSVNELLQSVKRIEDMPLLTAPPLLPEGGTFRAVEKGESERLSK